jgi:hypothetical protein
MKSDKSTILVPQFGEAFEGGFYTGQIRHGDKIYGVATAPKALGEIKGIWLPSYKDVETNCFHSMDNTRAMAEAGSPLAQQALAAEINGFKDWSIAARDVVELQYRNLKPGMRKNYCSFRDGDNPSSLPPGHPYAETLPAQTAVEAFRTGGAEAFEEEWYWTSTQYSSNYAWGQGFGGGFQSTLVKYYEVRARLVRLIQLNP